MSDGPNDVEVKIGVNPSAVAPGAQATKAAIGSIGEAVRAMTAQSAAQTKIMQEGFASMAKASTETKNVIKHDAEEEKASILGVVLAVHEGVESFNKFKEALS